MNWLNTRAWCPSPTISARSASSTSILAAGTPSCASSTSAGSRLSRRSRVSDRRMVNRLLSRSSIKPEHLLPLPLQVGLVDPLVPRVQLDLDHLLLLRWQLGGHVLLGPAQHQRPDPAAQLGQPGRVAVPLDRPAVVLGEPVGDAGRGPAR